MNFAVPLVASKGFFVNNFIELKIWDILLFRSPEFCVTIEVAKGEATEFLSRLNAKREKYLLSKKLMYGYSLCFRFNFSVFWNLF